MNIILLGAPGAGKGTQAQNICSHYNIPHIATGDIIRKALKNGTELGIKSKPYLDKGQLIPDELVMGIVKERLEEKDCDKGFVFDGFPRTLAQAEVLGRTDINIDKVINLKVKDEDIIKRMSGRRVCEACGTVFHEKNNPPKQNGKCDICGGTLFQREDDTPETVKKRLTVYHRQTEPLIAYYEKQGKLFSVEGNMNIDEITKKAIEFIEA